MKDFMNMFQKSFENPMADFTKNFDMTKMFNPAAYLDMYNKTMEMMPWYQGMNKQNNFHPENAFNFAENIKGLDLFSDLSHLSLENTQAMMRRQAEIIQRYSSEVHKFLQSLSPANDQEQNMKLQADFMRSSFQSLVNDFKELAEMYSKANLETFEAASNKMCQHMNIKGACENSSCSSQDKNASPKSKK
jgi:phasin family protein